MCHRHRDWTLKYTHQQQGSALVIALFIIVVMAVLAASLLRMGSDADEGINLEVWSLRAFYSANSAADSALAQLFPIDGSTPSCDNVNSSWSPPDVIGFHGCDSVQLSCTVQQSGTVSLFRIRSTAVCETGDCSTGSNDQRQCLRVSRSVEVEARE